MNRIIVTIGFALVLALSTAAGAATRSVTDAPPADLPKLDSYAEVAPGGASERSRAGLLRAAGGGRGQLLTGFGDALFTLGADSVRRRLLEQTAELSGEVVRLYVDWRLVAPSSPVPGFQATDPGDSQYSWNRIDAAVTEAEANGLRPLLLVTGAPDYAEGANRDPKAAPGTWKPKPTDVADFARAIATRYSGGFEGLPVVRDYMLWNEPNLPTNLTPQFDSTGRKPLAAGHYREMLNAFYEAVNAVDAGNRVLTGGTAPYGSELGSGAVQIRPLLFWREVMCVSGTKKPKADRKCPVRPKFDVLSHHPINTSGGPTTSAVSPDDISTPDLHNLVDVLRVAERGGNIGTKGKHQVWATELWWESNPPDAYKGNPSLAKQAEWYAQSMYLLWKQGASAVLLYQVRDDPAFGPPGRSPGSAFQTGVYFADDTPKPSSRAARFPFVADRASKGKVTLWGIPPVSGKLTVSQSGKGPKKVTSAKVTAGKIFTKTVKLSGRRDVAATVGGESSLSYPVR